MLQVAGYVELTLKFAKEGSQWTAECVELGTATCGDSFEEVADEIGPLIELHLNSLEQIGTRAAFFRKHGIRFSKAKPAPRRRRLSVDDDDIVQPFPAPVAAAAM